MKDKQNGHKTETPDVSHIRNVEVTHETSDINVMGVLMFVVELSLVLSHASDPWMHVRLGALGAALAMLGPGAWSVDARLFGRKRIEISSQ